MNAALRRSLRGARQRRGATPARSSPGPSDRLPRDLAEAYRLQAAVARELGAVGGWKVAAVTPAQRAALGVDRPIGAPLLRPWMHDVRERPAPRCAVADFIAPKLECEIAFELARRPAVAPRPAVHARGGARGDRGATHCRRDRRFTPAARARRARRAGRLLQQRCAGRRARAGRTLDALDFARVAIVLTRAHDGAHEEVARGSGKAILDGDPFGTVVSSPTRRPLRRAACAPATSSPPARAPARRRYRARAPTAPRSGRSAASSSCSRHSRRRLARVVRICRSRAGWCRLPPPAERAQIGGAAKAQMAPEALLGVMRATVRPHVDDAAWAKLAAAIGIEPRLGRI